MSDDNIININDKKKRSKKPSQNDEIKLTAGIVEEFLIRWLQTGKAQVLMPTEFLYKPLNIFSYQPDQISDPRIVLLENGIACELSVKHLASIIRKKTTVFAIPEHPCRAYAIGSKRSLEVATGYMFSGPTITDWPLPLGFKSSPGYFFERHPFDPVLNAKPRQFPIINSFLKRMENADGLCQIIGSVLAGKPLRKRSPLIYGYTNSGKSTFFLILKRLFGKKACAEVPKTFEDKHSTTFVENKAAWFADEVRSKFIQSQLFKTLTGGDTFPIRKIQRDYVDVPLNGVFFLNCNPEQLELVDDDAITKSRLLPCKLETWDKAPEKKIDMKELADKAAAEFPYFIGYCLTKFQALDGAIDVTIDENCSSLDEFIVDDKIDIEAIFDRYFTTFDYIPGLRNDSITSSDFLTAWERISRENPAFAKTTGKKQFERYVKTRLGLKTLSIKIRLKNCDGNLRIIPGLKLR